MTVAITLLSAPAAAQEAPAAPLEAPAAPLEEPAAPLEDLAAPVEAPKAPKAPKAPRAPKATPRKAGEAKPRARKKKKTGGVPKPSNSAAAPQSGAFVVVESQTECSVITKASKETDWSIGRLVAFKDEIDRVRAVGRVVRIESGESGESVRYTLQIKAGAGGKCVDVKRLDASPDTTEFPSGLIPDKLSGRLTVAVRGGAFYESWNVVEKSAGIGTTLGLTVDYAFARSGSFTGVISILGSSESLLLKNGKETVPNASKTSSLTRQVLGLGLGGQVHFGTNQDSRVLAMGTYERSVAGRVDFGTFEGADLERSLSMPSRFGATFGFETRIAGIITLGTSVTVSRATVSFDDFAGKKVSVAAQAVGADLRLGMGFEL